MTTVAVVGIGYWGKNLVRIFSNIAEVKICVHTGSPDNEEWIQTTHPGISLTTDYGQVLSDPAIDAIVIATPLETHYQLTRQALQADKDVFVEKPLAETTDQTSDLINISRNHNRILFVGYIFSYHPTIQPLIGSSPNKSIKWARFTWDKLGEFERDIFLDLVTHPVALALTLFQNDPSSVEVLQSHAITNSTDILSMKLSFPNDCWFGISINRLMPESQKSMQILLEDGDLYHWTESKLMYMPQSSRDYKIVSKKKKEPLRVECEHFLQAVRNRSLPLTNGHLGHRVNLTIEELREQNKS